MEPFIEYTTIETIQALPFFAHKPLRSVTPLLPREHGNAVMRVATTEGEYVVRQGTRGESSMEVEYRAGRLAYAVGIAPEILFYDADRALAVLAFVPGEHCTHLNREMTVRLAHTLQKLHTVPYRDEDFPKIDLRHLIEPDRPEIIAAFATVERFPDQLALCHHDLTPRNILWNHDQPTLIDFEFAGVGDVCFDLAAVCVEFAFDGEAESIFLAVFFRRRDFSPAGAGLKPRLPRDRESDLKREDSVCPPKKLAAYKVLYRALRRQWFARHGIDQIP